MWVMKQSKGLPAPVEVAAADKAAKTPPKQTFYCVMAEFYTDGTVKTAVAARLCRGKPRNRDGINPIMRFSNTWFEAESEAEEYRTAVKAPSMEGGAA